MHIERERGREGEIVREREGERERERGNVCVHLELCYRSESLHVHGVISHIRMRC